MSYAINTGLVVLGLAVLFASIGISIDIYNWHGGVSRKSGNPWKLVGCDSNDCRQYEDGEGNHIFISWLWKA